MAINTAKIWRIRTIFVGSTYVIACTFVAGLVRLASIAASPTVGVVGDQVYALTVTIRIAVHTVAIAVYAVTVKATLVVAGTTMLIVRQPVDAYVVAPNLSKMTMTGTGTTSIPAASEADH